MRPSLTVSHGLLGRPHDTLEQVPLKNAVLFPKSIHGGVVSIFMLPTVADGATVTVHWNHHQY